ncbi:MAG: TIGR03009 domain-containing protein [Planctomycetales bacterium]|nr:TIGR03009 domain-containing protein [Planctomycetales bacterium]
MSCSTFARSGVANLVGLSALRSLATLAILGLFVPQLPAQVTPLPRVQEGVVPRSQPQGAPAQPQAEAPPRPIPFFQLTQQESVLLDQILELWEGESGKVKSFKCPFERWVYDPVWGPGPDIAMTKSMGQLKYAKPDKGMFKITDVLHYTPADDPAKPPTWNPKAGEYGEHWVCDGEAVYQFNTGQKKLIVNELPQEMRGQAIAEGPLPFLFGAEKEKLKTRYSMKVTQTQPDIWIETLPRYREDAANYRRVTVILNREKFLPSAMRVELPNGKTREVFIFHLDQSKVNDPLDRFIGAFQQPRTPFGWTKEVVPAPTPQQQPPQAASRPVGPRR